MADITCNFTDTLTTHIFVDGDLYLVSDAVYGVKDSLIVPLQMTTSEQTAEYGLPDGCQALSFDFRLQPEVLTHFAGSPQATHRLHRARLTGHTGETTT